MKRHNKMYQSMLQIPSLIVIPGFAAALVGCNNDSNHDVLRSSNALVTNQLSLVIEADVHTHLGEGDELDETHTTVSVELYGFHSDGYYYPVKLNANDRLSAGIGSERFDLIADYYPKGHEPMAVLYYHDFESTSSLDVFNVTFDRERDAALHNVSLTLPASAEFEATTTGNIDQLNFNDTITFKWDELDDYGYALIFEVICQDANQQKQKRSIQFPSSRVTSIASPFEFTPSDFFSIPSANSFTSCNLSSTLKTYSDQTPEASAPFAALNVHSTQQQRLTFPIGHL